MNLNIEEIERRCLGYLKQTSNITVTFKSLVRHLRNDETCPTLEEGQLLEFLRDHELFYVIELPDTLDETAREKMADLDIDTGPRVALGTRVPARDQASWLVLQQISALREALAGAVNQIRAEGGRSLKEKQFTRLLKDAEALEQSARQFLPGKQE